MLSPDFMRISKLPDVFRTAFCRGCLVALRHYCVLSSFSSFPFAFRSTTRYDRFTSYSLESRSQFASHSSSRPGAAWFQSSCQSSFGAADGGLSVRGHHQGREVRVGLHMSPEPYIFSDGVQSTRRLMPNEVTGGNAGEPHWSPIRAPKAARIAQFCRSESDLGS
jgi:hypothetical protein